jgi:hypothetical protein
MAFRVIFGLFNIKEARKWLFVTEKMKHEWCIQEDSRHDAVLPVWVDPLR